MELETIKNKMYSLKKVLIPLGIVILIVSGYGIGSSAAGTKIDGEKVKYDALVKKIEASEEKLEENEKEIKRKQDAIKASKEEFAKVIGDITKERDNLALGRELFNKTVDLESEITESQGKLDGIKTEVVSAQSQLDSIQSAIKVKNEEPIQLPAGQLVVGKDIKAGRYKILPVGRGSNFALYDSSGSSIAHTIISSTAGHGVPEYVTLLSDGYIIDANSPFKYVPVE